MEKVVILGGGESGYGSAILAQKKGCSVFLSDRGVLAERYRNMLIENKIDFEEGKHSLDKILSADVVVKSPGVPDSAEIILQLHSAGINVISEMEFAYRYTKAKILSITGSNGKTTTATLTYKIFLDGGINVKLAGNIGDSFAYSVVNEDCEWYVLELSSFQLDGCYNFKSDIAIITNITPDHLDRYEYDMNRYIKSKFRICLNQTPDDYFIYSSKDPSTGSYIEDNNNTLHASRIPISTNDIEIPQGGYMSSDMSKIICRFKDVEVVIPVKKLKIKGLHNYSNIMDSVLSGLIAGINKESIIRSVLDFGGVEHRMEIVDNIDGVLYINDSKATNIDSAWYALESVNSPVVWIAGGTDKGNDYSPLFDLARDNVHTLICMGLDNRKIADAFTGIIPTIFETDSLDMAMEKVIESAKEGDAVLLSPCCASFDLFNSYEDRGCQFKGKVKSLKK